MVINISSNVMSFISHGDGAVELLHKSHLLLSHLIGVQELVLRAKLKFVAKSRR